MIPPTRKKRRWRRRREGRRTDLRQETNKETVTDAGHVPVTRDGTDPRSGDGIGARIWSGKEAGSGEGETRALTRVRESESEVLTRRMNLLPRRNRKRWQLKQEELTFLLLGSGRINNLNITLLKSILTYTDNVNNDTGWCSKVSQISQVNPTKDWRGKLLRNLSMVWLTRKTFIRIKHNIK